MLISKYFKNKRKCEMMLVEKKKGNKFYCKMDFWNLIKKNSKNENLKIKII